MGRWTGAAMVMVVAATLLACGGQAKVRHPSTCMPMDWPVDEQCQSEAAQRYVRARMELSDLATAFHKLPPGCPTIAELRAAAATEVDDPSGIGYAAIVSETDPWGTPYALHCDDDEFFTISAGPDLELGSADDLEVGPRLLLAPPPLPADESPRPRRPCPNFPGCAEQATSERGAAEKTVPQDVAATVESE